MTQAMKTQDYLPLIEGIRGRISTWTSRYLSYAGRMLLIKSVLLSVVNFWAAAFRLPSQCIKEIDQLCSAFLWSGPDLKTFGAKVAWKEVCKPTNEGELGICTLKEVNKVYGLKLIWRLFDGDLLWGKWIKANLLKSKSFWEVSEKTQVGSWMWRKMLKLRDVAKSFHMKEVGNGRHTTFWYDKWCDMGVMYELLGNRGIIDMGIGREVTVEEVLLSYRRRKRHRRAILNDIERELDVLRDKHNTAVRDLDLWCVTSGFKLKFSTHIHGS